MAGSSRDGKLEPAQLVRTAVTLIAQLTGRQPETVLGLRKEEDGWKVTVELVELSRIPSSTDLLGSYVVTLDDSGDLLGYERIQRYQRGQTSGGQQ